MQKALGPILYIGHPSEDTWRFYVAVLVVGSDPAQAPLDVRSSTAGVTIGPPEVAADFRHVDRGVYWRWSVEVPRTASDERLSYTVSPKRGVSIEGMGRRLTIDHVVIPAKGELPRLAFFSCNGFSEAPTSQEIADGPQLLWKQLVAHHMQKADIPGLDLRNGFHVLVGGGDQLYADSLWDQVEELKPYRFADREEKLAAKPSPTFGTLMLRAYIDLYIQRWTTQGVADAFARLPGIFTWDDHDIFDGWGSYDDKLQACCLYQSIFKAARTAFEAFQLGGLEAPLHRQGQGPHFLQVASFPARQRVLDMLLLDLRSERSLQHVMSETQWKDIKDWLEQHKSSPGLRRHLIVVSTIPVVFMRFSPLEERLGAFRDLDDDMRDQWESVKHRGERAALIMNLLAYTKEAQCRITILSGDVHVGSRGRVVSRDSNHLQGNETVAFIEQVTASGIVHPPPSILEFLGMRLVGSESRNDLSPFVSTELLPVGTSSYLRDRNWLSIGFDETSSGDPVRVQTRLWAQWCTKDGGIPEQVVVATA